MDSPTSETTPNPISLAIIPFIKTEEEEEEEEQSPKIEGSGSPKNEGSHSSEETTPDANTQLQPSDQDGGLMDDLDDEDREYGCRYCDKTFSNKQALGGHQNAHKVERTIEKSVRDVHDSGLGYHIGSSSSNPHFLSPYQRSHDLINRSYLSWPYPSQQHRNLPIGYNPRPGMATTDPFGPRSVPAYNSHVFAGWSAPLGRFPQFLGPMQAQQPQLSLYGPSQSLSLRFGEGSSSSSSVRPVTEHHQSLTAFAGTWRLGPGGNPSRPGEQEAAVDESGLDLTLKL